jgi:hypothetical protein
MIWKGEGRLANLGRVIEELTLEMNPEKESE